MSTSKYPKESKINPNHGIKTAIKHLIEAYGFTTRQAIAEYLVVSKSKLANRYMRDTFPGDWKIQCALKTGASLRWLSTPVGPMQVDAKAQNVSFVEKKINGVKACEYGDLLFYLTLLLTIHKDISAIVKEYATYLAKRNSNEEYMYSLLTCINGTHFKYKFATLSNIS